MSREKEAGWLERGKGVPRWSTNFGRRLDNSMQAGLLWLDTLTWTLSLQVCETDILENFTFVQVCYIVEMTSINVDTALGGLAKFPTESLGCACSKSFSQRSQVISSGFSATITCISSDEPNLSFQESAVPGEGPRVVQYQFRGNHPSSSQNSIAELKSVMPLFHEF